MTLLLRRGEGRLAQTPLMARERDFSDAEAICEAVTRATSG
jgi:hypothetical protein